MKTNKKILIVSAKAGAGHLMAAKALEAAAKEMLSGAEVRNIDLLDYSTILSKEFYGEWYLDLVNRVPAFYAWLYEHVDNMTTGARLLADRISAQKFKDYVLDFKPDIVLASNFLPANLLTFWRKAEGLKFKILLTTTDFDAHPLYYDEKIDRYSASSDEVKEKLIALGVKKEKVAVCGIPVDPKYSKDYSQVAIRGKLRLNKDKITIYFASGATGLGDVADSFKKILRVKDDFQMIAVAGKNEKLKAELESIVQKSKHKVVVLGFVDKMEEVYAACDFIITKAGGLTVSESLAMGLALVITKPYPGQEEANAEYLLRSAAALRADKPQELVKTVKLLLTDKKLLQTLKSNARKIARPRAAYCVIENIKDWL